MNEDEKQFEDGFYGEFEASGERAVQRRLASGDYSSGKRPMAEDWLDRKATEREQRQALAVERAEARANCALAISILAIVATLVVPFVTSYIR